MSHSHSSILSDVRKEFDEIFEGSSQSVYVYLDDDNKVCNERFATLLGYKSAKEWAGVKENFPEAFVQAKDRMVLVSAFQDAVGKMVGSTVSITWKKKNGGGVSTTTILVPIVKGGHRMALHFITPK